MPLAFLGSLILAFYKMGFGIFLLLFFYALEKRRGYDSLLPFNSFILKIVFYFQIKPCYKD